MTPTVVPARSGGHAKLRAGQKLKVISTHGAQVVDVWAFCTPDASTYLSMCHSRTSLRKLIPAVGDVLVGNTRQAMVALVEDSTPGAHDMLLAACDEHRYRQLGAAESHASCADNLQREAAKAGVDIRQGCTPDPLNLFMNVFVERMAAGGKLKMGPTSSVHGQYVVLLAKVDCIVFLSACPMDLVPGNGDEPTSIEFEVYD